MYLDSAVDGLLRMIGLSGTPPFELLDITVDNQYGWQWEYSLLPQFDETATRRAYGARIILRLVLSFVIIEKIRSLYKPELGNSTGKGSLKLNISAISSLCDAFCAQQGLFTRQKRPPSTPGMSLVRLMRASSSSTPGSACIICPLHNLPIDNSSFFSI